MKFAILLAFSLISFFAPFDDPAPAPIVEKEFEYKTWKHKSVNDGKEIKLRDFVAGKKLVLVVYFAPWCRNSGMEAPFIQKMYEKYRGDGFDVIAVGLYGSTEEMRDFQKAHQTTYTTVYETTSYNARTTTMHYENRQKVGDTRKWGTPWNIFLEPAKLLPEGDILTNKAFIANGEFYEAEAEKFIRQKLGLPEMPVGSAAEKREIEACANEPAKPQFKKP